MPENVGELAVPIRTSVCCAIVVSVVSYTSLKRDAARRRTKNYDGVICHRMAFTIWFTGLSAAGKSTLALSTAEILAVRGIPHQVIDGDELRRGPCADLGYSREDRRENIRRAAGLCERLNASGTVVIAALISPYRDDRDEARRIIGVDRFHEVYLSTPLSVCEFRDPKGLYRRARAGEIVAFTGVNDPYEIPPAPQLTLDTHLSSVAECMVKIRAYLNQGLL